MKPPLLLLVVDEITHILTAHPAARRLMEETARRDGLRLRVDTSRRPLNYPPPSLTDTGRPPTT
ncbi:hypothetical protein ACFRFJ_28310 [Streptomyces hydrogenans]|uniref:hypothetical protein n=1 Tax=Streptomyces hydrogenans TaxID=1873719 RepID=UPI003681B64F